MNVSPSKKNPSKKKKINPFVSDSLKQGSDFVSSKKRYYFFP